MRKKKSALKRFTKWFDTNVAWIFVNGFKQDDWRREMRKKYGISVHSKEVLKNTAQSILGIEGAMISASKSGYMRRNPDNKVVFNGCVCVGANNIWWGDIDITKSADKLQKLADTLGEEVYVLYEYQGRWISPDSGETVFDYRDRAVDAFQPSENL